MASHRYAAAAMWRFDDVDSAYSRIARNNAPRVWQKAGCPSSLRPSLSLQQPLPVLGRRTVAEDDAPAVIQHCDDLGRPAVASSACSKARRTSRLTATGPGKKFTALG